VHLAQEYVRLGLALDRLSRGTVDAWTGPAHVRAEVESGPAPQPLALAARARVLLAELPSSGLPSDRAAFLRGQLVAVEVGVRVLGGDPVGFLDQVEACFQVRPEMGDEQVYAAAHLELEALLPGSGPLLDRYASHRAARTVPPDRLGEAVRAVSGLLGARTRREFPLPADEGVSYEVVTGRPWAGLNSHGGRFRSTVALNADLPVGLGSLLGLVAHEAYPGHHTERCRKQAVRGDLPERQLWLVGTPENLLAEGLADLGLAGLDLLRWGPVLTELYADLGIAYDGELDERVTRAAAPLVRVRQDVALLLHDRGAALEDAEAHLARWGLQPPERVRQHVAFVTDPLWRTHITTYVEGARLVGDWLAARPAGQPVGGRFVRLLDEQLTPAALQEQLT